MNPRDNFISIITDIDNFYIKEGWEEMEEFFKQSQVEKKCKTYKEYFTTYKPFYLSSVDIDKIKRITLSNDEMINPFLILYEQDKETINDLFYLLAKVHITIKYFISDSDPMRDIKTKNTHKNISRKMQSVIDIIQELEENSIKYDNDKKTDGQVTLSYLKYILGSLNNKHYTKVQLFQNLLYYMNVLLYDKFYHKKEISKKKIYTITNLLIKEYFEDDNISFTTKTDLRTFKKFKYNYETQAGITLTHRP